MSRKELEKLKANVEKALSKLAEKEKKAALAAAEKAAAAHGFSLADIAGDVTEKAPRKQKAAPKAAAPARYRNPDDASQTWTGKGRQPNWFKSAIAKGTKPEDLEI
ncbi:MAG: H-NS family nucleoid-associated regulatory protein [Yoonia sp.]|uniref:H-NS histone family protein n=1 Tax=Yoonia sp. TaxID=2212373 RepID=UPI003EF259B9